MRFSIQKLILFLLLLFVFFLIYYKYSIHKNKDIIESYDNIYVYDSIYITNNINDNIIVITSMNINNGELQTTIRNGCFNIYLTSSNINSVPTYYTKMNFDLNGQIDIVDIHSGNGNYWYFNYGSSQGYTNKNSCPNEVGTGFKPIDLSTVPKSHIFENGIRFQNGSVITFDITGQYLVFEKIPTVNNSNNIQVIFNLGNEKGLLGNNLVILNTNLNNPANYYYYNGSCKTNNSRPNPSDGGTINNVQTRGIYISGTLQSILQFNNGCFIDGSISGPIIRFIGNNGVVQFDFSGTTDIFQVWNMIQGTYFYYNQKHQSGNSKVKYSQFNQSQGNRNYWSTLKTNLLPYTPFIEKLIYDNSLQYSYIDQIIIYNPSSTNQNAILIQVDTAYYNHFIGNNLPQGSNNYSISINSIIYDPTTGKMKTNPNSISRFLFNLNNSNGDIVDFSNGSHYFYYNYKGIYENLNIQKGITNITLCPNNMANGSNSYIPTQKNPYAFRVAKTFKSPNLLIFENTINLKGGLQIGIDKNGNCIWKGKTGQIEFILSKYNISENHINIFALTSDGGMDHGKMTYGNNISHNSSNLPTNSTPLKLNSSSISANNIINGNSFSFPISKLIFSNGMIMESDGENLWLQGIFGSLFTSLNSSSGNIFQIQNKTWDNKGSKGLTLGYSFGFTTSDSHVKNLKNGSNFSIINSTLGSSIGITKGILHYIGSWGDCGLSDKDLSVRPIFETSGDFLVGTNMSSKKNMLSNDTENNTKFSCENVTKLNPISNNLIVSFPNGYSDSKGKSIVKGGVCMIEPIGGIIHYIRKWGDCGISEKGIDIISIKEKTGNLLVGQSISSRTDKNSTDTTTGWPCSKVTRLDPVKNNLVVSFLNGYKDVHNTTLVKGGICIIEPINPQFLFL